jgi:hypothetical protein
MATADRRAVAKRKIVKGAPMVRQPPKFRQREITRTLRAAAAAGVQIYRIEIDTDGKIIAHLHGSGGDNPKKPNTADAVLESLKHGKQHGEK